MYDTPDLLRVHNDYNIILCIIDIRKTDPFWVQIHADLFYTVLKIFCHIDLTEIVRDTVGIDLRVDC